MNGEEQSKIPDSLLVNVASLCQTEDANENEYLRIGREIVKALEEHGFVYLQNYGNFSDMFRKIVEKMEKFFEFDEETKMKYRRDLLTFHGYTNEKLEIVRKVDTGDEESTESEANPKDTEKQNALNIRLSDDGVPELGRQSFDFRKDSYPTEVPGLDEAISSFLSKFSIFATKIFKSLDLVLDLPENLLQKYHDFQDGCKRILRVLRYAPMKGDGAVRLKEHIDMFVTVTFQLFQSNQGVQIKDKKGIWQEIKLPPNTVVMFPSQVLQILTGDRFPAALHRVTGPTLGEEKRLPRYAIACFLCPKADASVRSFDGSDKYAPMPYLDLYYRMIKNLSAESEWKKYKELREIN